MTVLEHPKGWVWVWGSDAAGVLDRLRGAARPGRFGFTVLFDDAPDPEDVPERASIPLSVWCVAAVCSRSIRRSGRGSRSPREHRCRRPGRGSGEWVGRSLSRARACPSVASTNLEARSVLHRLRRAARIPGRLRELGGARSPTHNVSGLSFLFPYRPAAGLRLRQWVGDAHRRTSRRRRTHGRACLGDLEPPGRTVDG